MSNIINDFLALLPGVMGDVAIAFLPVVVVFFVYQITLLKLPKTKLWPMVLGMVYAYAGLVLFFAGLEIGFHETGEYLGHALGSIENPLWLIPIGLVIGFAVVLSEPAVTSLVRQVVKLTSGTIHKGAIYVSLCIGVAVSVGLAMIRAIWNISLWYFVVPGYLIALILTRFCPPIFTAIAFDSGGVASGPMTSTFVLTFTIAVTNALHSDVGVGDSFGVVALVAMTPLITIQILGIIYGWKSKQAESILSSEEAETDYELDEEDYLAVEHVGEDV